MLCSNRPEGFGPASTISAPYPTQCFLDTILAPLPTWLYLAALVPLMVVALRKQPYDAVSPGAAAAAAAAPRSRWLRWLPSGVYYFLVFVIVLMETVEVARLAAADLGVGLLPFVYVGCAAAVARRATLDGRRARAASPWLTAAASAVFWALGGAVSAVKTRALQPFAASPALDRADSKYPVPDQVTDLVVLVIFYFLLAAAEIALAALGALQRRRRQQRQRGAADGATWLRQDEAIDLGGMTTTTKR